MSSAVLRMCPTDEVLGALVQRALDDAEAKQVTSHLDDCNACRQVVIAAVRAGIGAAPPTGTIAVGTPSRDRDRSADPLAVIPESSAPAIGTRVGRYEIRELLGSGGMGRVYVAYDAELDRSIALKVMRPDLARRAGVLAERLVRESRLMAKVVHPSVITVHDVGRVGNAVFIAMDLVRGETLGAYVKRVQPDWRVTLELLERAGRGLAAAHANGIIHRDFKPENVLVELVDDAVTRVVVTDFGVARAFGSRDSGEHELPARRSSFRIDPKITATGTAVGTPAYMAPEQLEGRPADRRVDVFAFAVSAWELLFGVRPYSGRNVDEIRQAMEQPIAAPEGDVPARVVRVLERGLALDPADRWPNIDALLAALARARRSRRGIALAAAASALVLAGGVVAVRALVLPSSEPADPCARQLAELDASVNPSREAVLRARLATDPKLADGVIGKIDQLAGMWRDTLRAACTPDAPVPLAAPAQACLEARRLEIASVVDDVIADGPAHAKKLLGVMGDPTLCTKSAPGLVVARVPEDPDVRRHVTALRYRGFDTEDLRDRGDYKRAIANAEEILAEAKAVWPPLEAEAMYLLGTAQNHGGDTAHGAIMLRDCAALATRVHHDYIATNAWMQLAQSATFDSGDPQRALEYIAYADAALDRIGRRPDVLAMLEYVRGTALIEADRSQEGEAALKRGSELADKVAPELVPLMTQAMGYLYEDQGRHADASLAYRKAIAQLADQEPMLPATEIVFRDRLAINLAMLGQAKEAEVEARKAVALGDRLLDGNSLDRAITHVNLAQVLQDNGRPIEALVEVQDAVKVIGKIAGERSERYGEVLSLHGAILVDLERFDEAAKLLDRACEIFAFEADGSSGQAECWMRQTDALAGLGKYTDALAVVEKVLPVFTRVYGPAHPQVANAYVERGVLRAELHQDAAAIADLEKARGLLANASLDPGHLAAAEWALGKLLWPTERAKAKGLVEQAVHRFANAGPTWDSTRIDAERFLASHK